MDNNKIIKIIFEISNNRYTVKYYVDTRESRTEYTEKTVPYDIAELMNNSRPVYHEKTTKKELFEYSFI